jgi:hypothetical protein
VIEAPRASEIDSHPASQVDNSQAHGIGRVAALDDRGRLGAWSNLGRNVVFAGADLRPRAVFDESVFADDEPSQYDLDIHAVLDLPDEGLVLTLNHFGMVRAFDREAAGTPGPVRPVRPLWTRDFVADVERYVVVKGRLVGSRPREQREPGLLVSEPLHRQTGAEPLDLLETLDSWGAVTAAVSIDSDRLAIGGDAHVSVAVMDDRGVARPVFDVTVEFEPAVLLWDGRYVWAAGSEAGAVVDDYDWDARRGGGFAALDPVNGHIMISGRFQHDLAWGTGGVAVAIVPGFVCGFGRRGEVHLYDTRDGSWAGSTAALSETSMGIAHGARLGDHLVYGFNRGGYRLWTLPVAGLGRTA